MKRKKVYPLWMIAVPAMIFIVFAIFPSTFGYIYAFTNWSAANTKDIQFVGFANIQNVLRNGQLSTAMVNSIAYSFGKTIVVTVFGLIFGYVLSQKSKSCVALRTIFFIPSILATIVVGLIFSALFQTRHGTINTIIQFFGGTRVDWFGARWTGVFAIICAEIWAGTGFATMITISAIQSVSSDYIEAALLDGASRWKTFHKIVIPLIFPTISVNVLFNLIYGLKLFDLIKFMTEGGPGFATESVGTLIMKEMSAGRYAQSVAVNLLFSVFLLFASILYQAAASKMEEK